MINIYSKNETNFECNGLAVLSDCKSCCITQELNGKYELELDHPKDKRGKYKNLKGWNIIKADGQLFRVPIQENVQDNNISIKVFANHIFYDLYWGWIENTAVSNATVQQALQASIVNPNVNILQCDDLGLSSAVFKGINPAKSVFDIINIWGGELYRDNFNIAIRQTIGQDKGVLVKYGKNILGFNERIDYTNVVTRVIPVGKDGLTIETVNGGVRYIDSPRINEYPFPITREIVFDGETDAASLKTTAEKLWGVVDVPETFYTINFVELSKTEQYKDYAALETVELGDMIIVRHSIFDVDIKQKVVKTKKDVLRDKLIEIELGSTRKTIADYINSLQKTITDTVQNEIEPIKNDIEGIQGNIEEAYAEISKTNESIELKVSKDGVIGAINLTSEELLIDVGRIRMTDAIIGWSQLDVATIPDLVDSAELSATLNSYVNNTTLSDALANYITTGSFNDTLANYVTNGGLTTILGQNYIITGLIAADKIAAGTLRGIKIKTGSDEAVNYSQLEDQYIDIYYGSTKRVHLGYDNWIDGTYRSYLELGDSSIRDSSGSLAINPGGASCLIMYDDHSANFSGDLQVNGDLTILGTANFAASNLTVVAKFA